MTLPPGFDNSSPCEAGEVASLRAGGGRGAAKAPVEFYFR